MIELIKTKPTLFLWGACDLDDAVNTDLIKQIANVSVNYGRIKRHDSLDFQTTAAPPCLMTSLLSLGTPAGSIAERVHETLSSVNVNQLRPHHFAIHKEVVKFPYIEYLKANAKPNDILVINFSSEFYTKFHTAKETFSITPQMRGIQYKDDILHWLYAEYISKPKYLMAFDDLFSLNETYLYLRDEFTKMIYEIFKNRVIIVKSHLTSLGYAKSIAQVSTVSMSIDQTLPFYKSSRTGATPNDYTYAQNIVDIIALRFKRAYPVDIPMIKLNEPVFLDLNHRWGFAPFHLTKCSTYRIGELIYKEIEKIIKDD